MTKYAFKWALDVPGAVPEVTVCPLPFFKIYNCFNIVLNNTRLTEHKQATRNGDANNHISGHHHLTNHNIDWDFAQCLTYSTNYFQRPTIESWYTNLEQTPFKRSQQLLTPYKRLIHGGINETDKRTSNRVTYSVTIVIPNRTFLVCFSGISGEFGRAMVRILMRRSRAKIPMARPNEPDMPLKRTKKVRLGIYRT